MSTPLKTGLLAASACLLAMHAQAQTLQPWMSPEVQQAWNQGYKGQNVTIQVIDDFRSFSRFSGNLGTGTLRQRHGEWTRLEAGLIAPLANRTSVDFYSTRAIQLARGLNVLNLSYGIYANAGLTVSQIRWDNQDRSIIAAAQNGTAVVAKAAGNDAVAVGAANSSGRVDYLNQALAGGRTTIYVGALSSNGTPLNTASLASYSNYAGDDSTVQDRFLVVGVEGSKTGLYGTSFAAPVVSGYAAILGSKFTSATPTQITNQLLNTARTDTINAYNRALHGRGEASIANALAPAAIQ